MEVARAFRQNPINILQQRYNIPQGIDVSNPNAIIQHLINSGQVSQEQVNQATMQMRNYPMFKGMF